MVGFLSLFKDKQNVVKKEEILFVHIPDDADENSVRQLNAKKAKDFAEFLDASKVYLNYGKDKYIEYDYTI